MSNLARRLCNLFLTFGFFATLTLAAAAANTPVDSRANAQNVQALLQKGRAETHRKQYDQAIFDFSHALLLAPNNRAAAELYGERGGAYVDKGDLAKAKADAARAIENDPGYFRGYQLQGRIASTNGRLIEAIAAYDKALSVASDFVQLYNNRGNVYLKLRDWEHAIRVHSEAIRRAPREMEAYVNRGGTYYDMGKLDAALADYHTAIMLDPADGDAYFNRALVYREQVNVEKAAEDFSEYIKRNPRDVSGYLARAQVYAAAGSQDDASSNVRTAEEIAGGSASGLNLIAWLRATAPEASLRDGKDAVAKATRSCVLTGWKQTNNIDTLAAAYAEAGEFEQAIRYQELALHTYSGDVRRSMNERLAVYRQKHAHRDVRKIGVRQ